MEDEENIYGEVNGNINLCCEAYEGIVIAGMPHVMLEKLGKLAGKSEMDIVRELIAKEYKKKFKDEPIILKSKPLVEVLFEDDTDDEQYTFNW